jgi:hypothetical protein
MSEAANHALTNARTTANLPAKRRGNVRAGYFAIVLAAATLVGQTVQFLYTAYEQERANEDTQWHTAVQGTSFQDSASALVGALNMQGFFGSQKYGAQALSIAVALLPLINSHPEGFDEVFFEMLNHHIDSSNQDSIFDISRSILDSVRTVYSSTAVSDLQDGQSPAFLDSLLGGVAPEDFQQANHVNYETAYTASWELDSVSQGLLSRWTAGSLSPTGQDLEGIALVNGDFSKVNLSGVNLKGAILYSVRLNGVSLGETNLQGALVRDVCMQGADLSKVTNFEKSQWTNTNWWDATLSKELKDYLNKNFNQPAETQTQISTSCMQKAAAS